MSTTSSSLKSKSSPARAARKIVPFGEAQAWNSVGTGWRQLYGSFQRLGISFEWHDFIPQTDLDWARSFHPESIEICLNLAGHGYIMSETAQAHFGPLSGGFYRPGRTPLRATRVAGERHQFLTVEVSTTFLRQHLLAREGLHPLVEAAVKGQSQLSDVSTVTRLSTELRQMLFSFRHPPVYLAAQDLWYQSKALELAAAFFFFQPPPGGEFFCDRQKRLSLERVEKVQVLLKNDLAAPLVLEEIGRQVGCSPFYLSRTFSKEVGLTIQQYLRQLRLDKAAELLRSGKYNVTEAAFAVGYASLSHFSQAFHETFGCCPGLYPLATPTQKLHRSA